MNIKTFISENTESMYKTLFELCHIPAPSHFEDERAEYCKAWLERVGAKNVYIDVAKNVVFPINCEGKSEITVVAAHTDTVFPDTEPMLYREEDGKVFCPGVKDDTASVVVLMHLAKYFIENSLVPEKGVMFVCNSCEEGLGNLKGVRQIFSDFKGRVANFISFDASPASACNEAVGSHRYEVEVKTVGGHSFGNFGNPNAIHKLSEMISKMYKIEVPQKTGTKTTYNVGGISGGTSVNTIAQSAKMLCEYRSDDRECLAYMKDKFDAIFEEARDGETEVSVTLIGERPCSNVDKEKLDALTSLILPIIEEIIGEKVVLHSGSTDCNIPLSLGVPAMAIGVCRGMGIHTREEYLIKNSVVEGLEIAIKTVTSLTEVTK